VDRARRLRRGAAQGLEAPGARRRSAPARRGHREVRGGAEGRRRQRHRAALHARPRIARRAARRRPQGEGHHPLGQRHARGGRRGARLRPPVQRGRAGRGAGRAGATLPVRATWLFRGRPRRPSCRGAGIQSRGEPARHLGGEGLSAMFLPRQIHLTLPPWVEEFVDDTRRYVTDEERVGLAIALSRRNIEHGPGGPFGAAVFNGEGRVVSVGVNRVVPQTCSVAHAEMLAYMSAQQRLASFRLNADGGRYTLATSAQPCCQCYGATVWAGVDELLIGARAEDVEELTEFDEGPLPADWIGELARRGIAVRRDILRDEARDVLASYGARGASY